MARHPAKVGPMCLLMPVGRGMNAADERPLRPLLPGRARKPSLPGRARRPPGPGYCQERATAKSGLLPRAGYCRGRATAGAGRLPEPGYSRGRATRVGPVTARAILVTGASRGIGAAIAQAFAAQGDRVAVHYRVEEAAAEAVRAGLPPGEHGGHLTVQGDLADPQAVRRMVDEAADGLGGLDVLVNNAGIYVWHPVTEVSYEDWQAIWQQTLDVNLTGAANATWCAVRHMIPRGGGRIINVTSRGAFRGEPRHPAYGASKAGLNAFGQSMARALAPHGIAVGSVAPGYVETDMTTEELASPRGDVIRGQSPFDRVARPEEIAAAVLYLASPLAEWASGTVLDLNGASYLR